MGSKFDPRQVFFTYNHTKSSQTHQAFPVTSKDRKMTHTATTIAMRISKPTLTHTSLSKLVFVINFFTLLGAAWLLHPSQSTKTSCDITNFSSPPIFSIFSLTMAPVQSKDTNSKPSSCSDSRHSKNKIMAQPKPKGSSIGM